MGAIGYLAKAPHQPRCIYISIYIYIYRYCVCVGGGLVYAHHNYGGIKIIT